MIENPNDPNDRDWGDHKVGQFDYYVREVVEWSEDLDNFDLNSADADSCQKWREMRQEYVRASLRLVNFISANPEILREQLETLLRDH